MRPPRSLCFASALACVVLTACGAAEVPFPDTLPSQRVIDAMYKTVQHNLSPIPRYHFAITIPKEWEIMDTRIVEEPTGDVPQEIAAFRAPGPWMDDASVLAGAEVAVSVLRSSGAIRGEARAREWLTMILDRTVPGHTVLQHQSITFEGRESADVLIRYGERKAPIIARFRVIPASDNRIFVVTASAPADAYPMVALELFTALATVELK